jgi:hypothetical protein
MSSARFTRTALFALLVALFATAAGVGANPSTAVAASPHRAAVIVDTGATVHKVVITFTEDSISGIEALQKAGANPVVYSMGPGGAVCRVFGVGRDAGPNCLGGQDGDHRYWAYFRAPAGTSSFEYSRVGAGTARVHDGDVEGWKFATGTAPAFVSLASLTPPPPPPPPPTTPATKPAGTVTPGGSTPGASPGAVAGPAAAGATSTSTLPVTGAAAANDATSATGKAGANPRSDDGAAKQSDTAKERATDADGQALDTALTSSEQDSGGSSTWSLLLFAVLLIAIVAAIFIVRRARKQPAQT